jgi:hypothetical protein
VKITKRQLRKIIKEELESEQDTGLADELFPGENMFEAVGVGTIALGTALGILGVYAVGKIGVFAKNILKAAGSAAQRAATQRARQLQRQMEQGQFDQLVEYLDTDENLSALVIEYHRLVDEVERIKGKRGPEFQQVRADRKRVASELSAAVDDAMSSAWEYAGAGSRHHRVDEPARKYARRRR